MAGYSGTPLPKKLGIKEGSRVALVNAPNDFESELGELPDNVEFIKRPTKSLDIILLFVLTERALTSAIRDPSLIPSFFAKGVPEYPAMLLSPESENFPPGESHQTPDADRDQRCNQAEGPQVR